MIKTATPKIETLYVPPQPSGSDPLGVRAYVAAKNIGVIVEIMADDDPYAAIDAEVEKLATSVRAALVAAMEKPQ